jgi:transmembrane sensor
MENARVIEANAATWFAKRDSESWQEEDELELDTWLNSNVAHRLAFIRVETAWKHAQRLKALRASNSQGEVPPVGAWQFAPIIEPKALPRANVLSRVSRSLACVAWMRGAAAGIAAAAIIATAWYGFTSRTPAYRTAIGGMETVLLQDGSTVTLNTNSEIRVALTPTQRTISLDGEAFFEVAKDPNRPFVVDVGSNQVTAVGTKFSVRRDGDNIRVAVTEGRVRVDAKDAATPPTQLEPGDVASSDRNGILVRQMSVVQLEAEDLSWRKGYVSFRDAALGEVVRELNRYNVRKITVASPAVAAIRVGGEFRVANVDAFVRLIQQTVPVHPVKRGTEIILEDD